MYSRMSEIDVPKEMTNGGEMKVFKNDIAHAWDEIREVQ